MGACMLACGVVYAQNTPAVVDTMVIASAGEDEWLASVSPRFGVVTTLVEMQQLFSTGPTEFAEPASQRAPLTRS